MPDTQGPNPSISKRLAILEHRTDTLSKDQQAGFDSLRQWQIEHEKKSDRIIQSQDELLALVEAMRWASMTRHVFLWTAGAVVALAAAWTWLHDHIIHLLNHRSS